MSYGEQYQPVRPSNSISTEHRIVKGTSSQTSKVSEQIMEPGVSILDHQLPFLLLPFLHSTSSREEEVGGQLFQPQPLGAGSLWQQLNCNLPSHTSLQVNLADCFMEEFKIVFTTSPPCTGMMWKPSCSSLSSYVSSAILATFPPPSGDFVWNLFFKFNSQPGFVIETRGDSAEQNIFLTSLFTSCNWPKTAMVSCSSKFK